MHTKPELRKTQASRHERKDKEDKQIFSSPNSSSERGRTLFSSSMELNVGDKYSICCDRILTACACGIVFMSIHQQNLTQ